MKKMLLGALLVVCQASAADVVATLAGRDPATEAERDFYAGDKRYIVVPICTATGGFWVPGWPAKDPEGVKAAGESGRQPFSCKDLADDPTHSRFTEVSTFVARYNVRMRTLNGLAGK